MRTFLLPTPANLRVAGAAFLVCQLYADYLILQAYKPDWLQLLADSFHRLSS